jgi:hypothetical protein
MFLGLSLIFVNMFLVIFNSKASKYSSAAFINCGSFVIDVLLPLSVCHYSVD